jgi:DNA-binding MurR/RpiR family transcriptional regulator
MKRSELSGDRIIRFMSEVAERIARSRDLLSPAERQVAEVVLRQPEGVAFGTVAEVAAVADTSGATVVRLATRLGYQGFSDLQSSVRDAIGARLRPAVEGIRSDVGPDVVGATLAAEVDNVRRTLDAVDPVAFDRAVGLLADVRRPVRALAGDAQAGIGAMLVTDLAILRPDVAEAQGSPAAVVRRLATLGGGPPPVVVAIDLRRYERWIVDAARQAVADGAALVAVTDSPLSPLAAPAEVTFAVSAEGAGPFDSHVGTLALVNALVTGVAARLRASATARIDALESHWHTSGALLDP